MFLFSDIKPTNQNKQLEPIQNRFFTLLQYGNDVPHNGSQKFTSHGWINEISWIPMAGSMTKSENRVPPIPMDLYEGQSR